MVNVKPFVIEYPQKLVFTGCEFVKADGEIFKSVKEFKELTSKGEFKTNLILFCPECGAGRRLQTWGFPTSESRKTIKKAGQCLNCGKRLTIRYCGDFEYPEVVTTKNEPRVYVRHVGGTNGAYCPRALKWWPVEDGKLAIEVVQDLYFSRTMYGKYWMEHALLRYRHIINLVTGQIYTMRGIDEKGQPSKYSRQKHRLQNFTFSSPNDVPCEMQDDFIRIVLEAMNAEYGLDYSIETKTASDNSEANQFICCDHKINMYNLGKLNYFFRMKSSDIFDMLELSYNNFTKNNKRIFPKLIALSGQGEVEWLPKYMQKRSIRNRLNKRVCGYFVYRWLYQSGVRDVNIMNNVVDTYIDIAEQSDRRCAFSDNRPRSLIAIARQCANPSAESIEFMRWALKGRSAESACQFIKGVFSIDEFTFSDSVRMFRTLPDNLRPKQSHGNLKDIHDALVVIDRKFRFGNREIRYSDVEKALEMECGEYSFKLAKDTDTLYDIGKAMGICVGSYSNDAVNKHCTIVTMSKNDKYVACIELRVHKKNAQMVQLKSRFNHTVSEIEPVTEWVTVTGVNAKCADYQNAVEHKRNGFDERDCDYHVENPRLNEPRRHRRNEEFVPNLDFEDDDIPFGAHIFPF